MPKLKLASFLLILTLFLSIFSPAAFAGSRSSSSVSSGSSFRSSSPSSSSSSYSSSSRSSSSSSYSSPSRSSSSSSYSSSPSRSSSSSSYSSPSRPSTSSSNPSYSSPSYPSSGYSGPSTVIINNSDHDHEEEPSRPLTPEELAEQQKQMEEFGRAVNGFFKWILIGGSVVGALYLTSKLAGFVVETYSDYVEYRKKNTFTVIRAEVALHSITPKLQEQFLKLAEAGTGSFDDTARLIEEVSMLLLRNDQYWSHADYQIDTLIGEEKASPFFTKVETQIRSKSSGETLTIRQGKVTRREGVDDDNAPEPGNVYVISLLGVYNLGPIGLKVEPSLSYVDQVKLVLNTMNSSSSEFETGMANLHPSEGPALSQDVFLEYYPKMHSI